MCPNGKLAAKDRAKRRVTQVSGSFAAATMAHGSLKRPLELTESNVLVTPPTKTRNLGDERGAVMVNYSPREMASRDWQIFTKLSLEDKPIYIEKLQWQRVVNMRVFMDIIHLHNNTLEYRLISADLTRRGIDAFKSNWKWSDPLPLLPGYFPHNFPPFQSFTAANTSIEEEFITMTRICAQIRGKTLHASVEQSAGTQNPKTSSERTVEVFTALSPLVLRAETRCERERLLMDMAASRLFTLKFSTGSSLGSSRYDLVTDAILWSVDFTFYLNTSTGSKHETFVVDDTSERDILKPNIDNIICFDDVDDSITTEFKKAADRSENCFNVFFVVPHVIDVNTEAQYYLIDHSETLLNVIRGKLVVDRPRFLIALKSQSLQFIRKAAHLEGTTQKAHCKPQLQAIPLSTELQQAIPVSTGLQSSTMNFNLPPPSIPIPNFPAQQTMLPPACVSIGMGPVPPPMMLPSFGCPLPPLPPFQYGIAPPMSTVVPQPAPVESRPNLVVLTSNSRVVQSTPIPTVDTAVVLRPVTVEKGSGTKFSPSEMAKRDEEKLVKCNWEVQKALLFKLPLNRVLNLFFHMRGRVRGNPRLNNMFSLLPNRFRNAGIAKIPSGWTLKDELPMLPGYQPLTGIIPIMEFEIDEVADDANFEQVAKTVETVIMKARPVVPPASSEESNASKTKTSTSRQTIYGKVS
ncbi:hypothetical protein GCK32_001961 [Trichostrongylus colubriformis]|uniref:BCD1 alpha/beta domain-containing protein n=1 Tax=Trichostrongylus colubriformis TaxID=6319 RepID=A0AAN8G108_TRICO